LPTCLEIVTLERHLTFLSLSFPICKMEYNNCDCCLELLFIPS
jgi:hypothetical protein